MSIENLPRLAPPINVNSNLNDLAARAPILPNRDSVTTINPALDTLGALLHCGCIGDAPGAYVSEFQAEWPASLAPPEMTPGRRAAQIIWDIFCVIFFPLGLVRLALHAIHWFASRLGFLPAAWKGMNNWMANHPSRGGLQENPVEDNQALQRIPAEHIHITAPDGVVLEGIFAEGSIPNKAVIFSPGNGMSLRGCDEIIARLQATGVSVLMVNPRGVEGSQGEPSDRLPLDTYTAYEWLIQKRGFDPNNIVHWGWSLGGLYGPLGAALIQEKYPDSQIKVITDHAPGDLAITAEDLITNFTENFWWGGRWLGSAAGGAMKTAGLQMVSAPAFQRLKGECCVIYDPRDPVVSLRGSNYTAIHNDPLRSAPLKCIRLEDGSHGTDHRIVHREIFRLLGIPMPEA